jgi:hypothetical protein
MSNKLRASTIIDFGALQGYISMQELDQNTVNKLDPNPYLMLTIKYIQWKIR